MDLDLTIEVTYFEPKPERELVERYHVGTQELFVAEEVTDMPWDVLLRRVSGWAALAFPDAYQRGHAWKIKKQGSSLRPSFDEWRKSIKDVQLIGDDEDEDDDAAPKGDAALDAETPGSDLS